METETETETAGRTTAPTAASDSPDTTDSLQSACDTLTCRGMYIGSENRMGTAANSVRTDRAIATESCFRFFDGFRRIFDGVLSNKKTFTPLIRTLRAEISLKRTETHQNRHRNAGAKVER